MVEIMFLSVGVFVKMLWWRVMLVVGSAVEWCSSVCSSRFCVDSSVVLGGLLLYA